MDIQFNFLPQLVLHLLLVLLLLLLLPLLQKILTMELQLLSLEVEVDQISLLVLFLADDADLPVSFHLLQSLP